MASCVWSLAFLVAGVEAWGAIGHEVVASVAQTMLTPEALKMTSQILGGSSIASVASWADQIKDNAEWRWSTRLHFVDTKSWECGFNPATDCKNQLCVVGAINNYTTRLMLNKANEDLTVDLKFLVHFVGDIAQPLHVSFSSDRGGDSDHGRFCNRKTNLHAVWDSGIIERRVKADFNDSQQQFTEYLINLVPKAWIETLPENCGIVGNCTAIWATDSAKLACQKAYTDEMGNHVTQSFNFCQDYYEWALPVVEKQLLKGGVRLAYLLNKIAAQRSLVAIRQISSAEQVFV